MTETMYENSGDCPWNRNGTQDAIEMWEIREREARAKRAGTYSYGNDQPARKLSWYQRQNIKRAARY